MSAAILIKTRRETISAVSQAYKVCTEQSFSSLSSSGSSLSRSATPSFLSAARANVTTASGFTFDAYVMRSFTVFERATLHPAAEPLRERMRESASLLRVAAGGASVVGIDVSADVAEFAAFGLRLPGDSIAGPGDASRYVLAGTSDKRVVGSATASGDKLNFTFGFA